MKWVLSLLMLQITCRAVIMPLEVFGKPGVILTASVNLKTAPTNASALYLKIHGLTYEGKASVKLNAGPWITLTDTNVIFPLREQMFWGMAGPLSTLRMQVPLARTNFLKGKNTLSFRFNDTTNLLSIGYRVLEFDFVDAAGNGLIQTSQFTQDNPALWKPILTNAADIEIGRKIWLTRSITDNKLPLAARCADCHFWDGSDLKYFNYSNKAIAQRAIFHGIKAADANRVASYIRSLPVPLEPSARPWNPPYQPGKGMDDRPVFDWLAGAGQSAVLEHDLDTLKYIWPEGPSPVDFTATLSARNTPIAIELPDWNSWLPVKHPLDALPGMSTNLYFTIYAQMRADLNGLTGLPAAKVFNAYKTRWDVAGANLPPRSDDPYAIRNVLHWRQVKTAEIMREWKLEEMGVDLFGPQSDNRRWFHGETFRLSPHMLHLPKFDSFYTESMQWYQLQLVLNSGNRMNPGIVPVDWGYQQALNRSAWNNPAQSPTYGIMALNMIKQGETVETGKPPGDPNGWNPFREDVFWLAPGSYLNKFYQQIPVETRRAVASALLTPWLAKAEQYTPAQYTAGGYYGTSLKNTMSMLATNLTAIGADPSLALRLNALQRKLWP